MERSLKLKKVEQEVLGAAVFAGIWTLVKLLDITLIFKNVPVSIIIGVLAGIAVRILITWAIARKKSRIAAVVFLVIVLLSKGPFFLIFVLGGILAIFATFHYHIVHAEVHKDRLPASDSLNVP